MEKLSNEILAKHGLGPLASVNAQGDAEAAKDASAKAGAKGRAARAN
jgi:hypothetical protein